MKSIIQPNKTECYICGRNANYEPLDDHHVYSGACRKLSEKYGLKVYLHHNTCHLYGVHQDAELNRTLKAKVQEIAMQHYKWSIEDFRKIFGKSYV